MKKVSLIIPVYNVSEYLLECVDSVMNQTYENVEYIFVEDCSKDNSREILATIKDLYPNKDIKILYNEVNKGLSYTRNRGLDIASGDYISFVDSDDLVEPNFLESIITSMEKYNTSIGMCSLDRFIKTPKIKDKNGLDSVEDYSSKPSEVKEIFGSCWNKIYKRELIGDMRFPEGLYYEDFPFMYPLIIKAGKVSNTSDVLYHYRRNINGICLTTIRKPSIGVLDLYYSSKVLENNYKLVRQDDKYDKVIEEIVYREMLSMSKSASSWMMKDIRKKKRIINLLYYVANRYAGITDVDNKKIVYEAFKKSKFKLFRIPNFFIYLERSIDIGLSDEEILKEVSELIESVNKETNKCKVKEK